MMGRFILSSKVRVKAILRRNRKPTAQLEMTWPGLPAPAVPDLPDAFALRLYRDSDGPEYRQLVESTFGHRFELEYWLERTVSDGFFIVEEVESGIIAATCMAARYPTDRYPGRGNLGWLVARPEFQGNGLGRIVSAAVTRRLIEEGFGDIFLETDDWRLPAISIYLGLGWTPNRFSPEMSTRWAEVERQLSRTRPGTIPTGPV